MVDSAARRLPQPNRLEFGFGGLAVAYSGWMPDSAAQQRPLPNRRYTLHGGLVAHHILLHLCPDGPANLVQNYRLWTVWAIGPCLNLPGKKVFSGLDHVSVLENTSWVRVLADLLRRQA